MPQSGNVQAMYLNICCSWNESATWAAVGNPGDSDQDTGGPITANTTRPYYDLDNGATLSQECYTYTNGRGNPETYNLAYPDAINCALSFKFQ